MFGWQSITKTSFRPTQTRLGCTAALRAFWMQRTAIHAWLDLQLSSWLFQKQPGRAQMDEGSLRPYNCTVVYMLRAFLCSLKNPRCLPSAPLLPRRHPDNHHCIMALRGKRSATPTRKVTFLDLPGELRNQIYHLASCNEGFRVIKPYHAPQGTLLQVSRQIRAEYMPFYYATHSILAAQSVLRSLRSAEWLNELVARGFHW